MMAMLPADLAARLEAAGLPTNLEGMLEAAARRARSAHRTFVLCAYPRLWAAEDGEDDPNATIALDPTAAVGWWLLAAKEAQHADA